MSRKSFSLGIYDTLEEIVEKSSEEVSPSGALPPKPPKPPAGGDLEKWKIYAPIIQDLPEEHLEIIYILIYHHYLKNLSRKNIKKSLPPYEGKVMFNKKVKNNPTEDCDQANNPEPNQTINPSLPHRDGTDQTRRKSSLGRGVLYKVSELPITLQKILLTYLDYITNVVT